MSYPASGNTDEQNDLILARYTCIALQRLGGSAKKVKGQLPQR